MTDSPFIINVTEQDFEQNVLITSMTKPVLVDFWAGWCNPCKILMPILSKLAIEYNGEFYLAKVDSDLEKNLADKYGVRSLPTVKLFKLGEVVDEFHGAIPESEVREFIDQYTFKKIDIIIQEAENEFSSGNLENAKHCVSRILSEDKFNKKGIILSIKISLAENQPDQAEDILKHLPISMSDDTAVKKLRASIALLKEVEDAPDIETLKAAVSQSDDTATHYQLACRYALLEQYEEALKEFIEIVEKDKDFKDGAARKNIIAIFELLGGSGPLVNIYRIKLSRLLH